MNQTLKQALQPVASFVISNSAVTEKKLCLFSGHFDTAEVVTGTVNGSPVTGIVYDDKTGIVAAGYTCDYVATDYSSLLKAAKNPDVDVRPNSARCRYQDFLNYIALVGSKVTKIRLTNLTGTAAGRAQFDREMEISASEVGSKAGSDFIQLNSYKNPANYDQDLIEIDLERQNLILDATTLAFLTIAPGAQFSIEFTLDK